MASLLRLTFLFAALLLPLGCIAPTDGTEEIREGDVSAETDDLNQKIDWTYSCHAFKFYYLNAASDPTLELKGSKATFGQPTAKDFPVIHKMSWDAKYVGQSGSHAGKIRYRNDPGGEGMLYFDPDMRKGGHKLKTGTGGFARLELGGEGFGYVDYVCRR